MIDFKYLILGFVVGIFLVYITQSKPKIVIKYPTPDNVGKVTYTDNSGTCYKYKAEKTECLTDEVKSIPIQQ